METRQLGNTGLQVSRLGVGLAEIGGLELTASQIEEAERVLNRALDGGITFLDTAACYGNSEELVGRAVARRRQEYVLASKCGHITGGYEGEEWTAKTVTDSIDRSLVRLKTDYVDIMQLHSCGVDILERGDVIEALLAAKQAGKTRYAGYSGDNEAAAWAVASGHFDTLQTSFNLVDQRAHTRLFPQAQEAGMGIIVKRPIANGAWGADSSPSGYAEQYFRRAQAMQEMGPLPDAPEDRILLALGFTLYHDAVDTAIVGTRNPQHMASNLRMVAEDLPISAQTVEELRRRFAELDSDWMQRG
jgi:aryl-alcohol dehydrogenase-like predicted oxidoreductase